MMLSIFCAAFTLLLVLASRTESTPARKTPAQLQIDLAYKVREIRIRRVYRRIDAFDDEQRHRVSRRRLQASVLRLQASTIRLQRCMEAYGV
jgi:hypothetical protein